MIPVDLHTHNVNSLDGLSTLYEMAKEAAKKKMKILGVTPHGPGPEFLSMPEPAYEVFKRVPKTIEGVRILMGSELNIGDENFFLERESSWKHLKIRIAGIHTALRNDGDAATKEMIKAIGDDRIHFISHPYYRSNVDIEKVAEAACRKGKLLEINNSTFKYNFGRESEMLNRVKKMVEICQENDHQMIINSDAHIAYDIGEDEHIMKYQDKLGIRKKDIINYDIDRVKEYFDIE